MTIQQMEYIVAVDQYRHFVRAAEACGVSQSTLSTLVRKLEEELAAANAFADRDGNPTRPDLLKALNRMSSMLYILMIQEKSKK